MSATLFRLAPGARTWARALAFEPDGLQLVSSEADALAWLAEGPLPTRVLLESALEGEPYALALLPGVGPAWVPGAALSYDGASGQAHLGAPADALGSRVALVWRPEPASSGNAEAVFWRAGLEGDDLLFRRWDEAAGAPSGPLRRASALDVIEAWAQPEPWGGSGDQGGEARPLRSIGGAGASGAALLEAFLRYEGAGGVLRAPAAPSVLDSLSRSRLAAGDAAEGGPASEGAEPAGGVDASGEPSSSLARRPPAGTPGAPGSRPRTELSGAPGSRLWGDPSEALGSRPRGEDQRTVASQPRGEAQPTTTLPGPGGPPEQRSAHPSGAAPAALALDASRRQSTETPSASAEPGSGVLARRPDDASSSERGLASRVPAPGGRAGDHERGAATGSPREPLRSPLVASATSTSSASGESLRGSAGVTGADVLARASALTPPVVMAPRAAASVHSPVAATTGAQSPPGGLRAAPNPVPAASTPREGREVVLNGPVQRSASPALPTSAGTMPSVSRASSLGALDASGAKASEARGPAPSLAGGPPAGSIHRPNEHERGGRVEAMPAVGLGAAAAKLEPSASPGRASLALGGSRPPSSPVAAMMPAAEPVAVGVDRGAGGPLSRLAGSLSRGEDSPSAPAGPAPARREASPRERGSSTKGPGEAGGAGFSARRSGYSPGRLGLSPAFVLGPMARTPAARSIEIGEIVVEIAADAPAWQPRPEPPPAGSLIAAIPMTRVGGRR